MLPRELREPRCALTPELAAYVLVGCSPLHRRCLEPFVLQAVTNLAARKVGRCTCDGLWCQANQVAVEAWHLRWAMFDTANHDPGDEDARCRDA